MPISKEKIADIVRSHKWSIQGFNGVPLYIKAAATVSGWMLAPVFGINYTHFFYLFANNRSDMRYDEHDWQALHDAFYKKARTKANLKKIRSHYDAAYQDAIGKSEYSKEKESENLKNLNARTTEELIDLLQKLTNRISFACGIAHVIEGVTFGTEKNLRALLKDRGSKDEHDFTTLTTPMAESFLQEARIGLWKIKNAADKKAQKHTVEQFLQTHGWVENTYIGKAYLSADDILTRAHKMKHDPHKNPHDSTKRTAQKQELMQKYSFSKEERFWVEAVEFCFKWQDDRKKHILQSIDTAEPVLKALERSLEVKPDLLKFLMPNETTQKYITDTSFHKTLEKRQKGSAIYTTPTDTEIFVGSDYTYLNKSVGADAIKNSTTKPKKLMGTIASKGVVQGVVKLCMSLSDIEKIKPGEILVTSMTRPEYLPAMQKAAGFITDEGGITCHAAIVSREMKKPCIIGTRVATQVLKDGDKVELDAEQGIITIL